MSMSYEGYEQFLCSNGHYMTADAYADPIQVCKCGAKVVWWNSVDITNGTYDEDGNRIDGYVELQVKQSAVYEECPCCHHRELKSEETYHIPTDKGHLSTPRSIQDIISKF